MYKEKALGDVDIDPVYMNGWVAVYQFIFSIPLLIPSAVASNVAISDLCVPGAVAVCAFVLCVLLPALARRRALVVVRWRPHRCIPSHLLLSILVATLFAWFWVCCMRCYFLKQRCPCARAGLVVWCCVTPFRPANLWNGMRCLAQADIVFTATDNLTVDDCFYSPTYVSIYILFNLGYNVLIILILKYVWAPVCI